MEYQKPVITRREPIAALLTAASSDPAPDAVVSDRNVKENVQPITWGDATVAYDAPSIAAREGVEGLLGANRRNVKSGPDIV